MVQYRRVYGEKVTKRDRTAAVPMWEEEFKHWAVDMKRLSEEEAQDWWKEMLDDPRIERDNAGRGGRLQLFVPKAMVAREQLRDRFIENLQEEMSNPSKKCKEADRQALRDHVDRQKVSFADEFLNNGSPTPTKSVATGH